jgi:hypothetical protein
MTEMATLAFQSIFLRIDPDKVVPTKGQKESEDDLKAVPTTFF